MIANQFNSASGEIHVNLHSQDYDFGIFQQVFGRKMAEIDNYSKPQKQVRNVGPGFLGGYLRMKMGDTLIEV